MPDDATPNAAPRRRPRLPRISDMWEITDEMIAFADTYQQVWEHESKATIALGEFLHERSQSLKSQVELMRMGSGAFKRYTDWSEAIFGVRPETFMQGLMDQVERLRPRADRATGE